jgi:polyribonucleotide nucleotidyltransferase
MVKLGDDRINADGDAAEPGTGKASLSRRAILTGESPEDRIAAAGRGRGWRGRGGPRRLRRPRPRGDPAATATCPRRREPR